MEAEVSELLPIWDCRHKKENQSNMYKAYVCPHSVAVSTTEVCRGVYLQAYIVVMSHSTCQYTMYVQVETHVRIEIHKARSILIDLDY